MTKNNNKKLSKEELKEIFIANKIDVKDILMDKDFRAQVLENSDWEELFDSELKRRTKLKNLMNEDFDKYDDVFRALA